jgi:hypothetical protein
MVSLPSLSLLIQQHPTHETTPKWAHGNCSGALHSRLALAHCSRAKPKGETRRRNPRAAAVWWCACSTSFLLCLCGCAVVLLLCVVVCWMCVGCVLSCCRVVCCVVLVVFPGWPGLCCVVGQPPTDQLRTDHSAEAAEARSSALLSCVALVRNRPHVFLGVRLDGQRRRGRTNPLRSKFVFHSAIGTLLFPLDLQLQVLVVPLRCPV